ncbi:MAG TPA: transporter [Rhodocyclaceae bacterium]
MSAAAHAGPSEYVSMPNAEYGEKEIDFKYGVNSPAKPGDEAGQYAIGFGYGATQHWFTEVYLVNTRDTGDNFRLEAIEWENKFQLTEPGEYFADVGLLTEIEVPRQHGAPIELSVGALFQKDIDKFQLNGNVILTRQVRDSDDAAEHNTEIGYQWQIKYRWRPEFEFGLQGLGSMGKWDDWDKSRDQIHKVGPAIFGKYKVGEHQAIKYNAALLAGVSEAAPHSTLRFQVEYEF